jgi:hypothetical protein
VISQDNINKIRRYINILKQKKISVMYDNNTNLSKEQIWNQNILNVFCKMEISGYIVNPDWFHKMDKEDHIEFYKNLYNIWYNRLNISFKEKNFIVPGCEGKHKLFKLNPTDFQNKESHYIMKTNLNIINRLVSSSSIGVMYVLMGFCYVSNDVCETFPWIYASLL